MLRQIKHFLGGVSLCTALAFATSTAQAATFDDFYNLNNYNQSDDPSLIQEYNKAFANYSRVLRIASLNMRTVVVLPAINNNIKDIDGFAFSSYVAALLVRHGYYVIPPAMVREYFASQNLSHAEDIAGVNPQDIAKYFGADAIVYPRVHTFGLDNTLLSTQWAINGEFAILNPTINQFYTQRIVDYIDLRRTRVLEQRPIETLLSNLFELYSVNNIYNDREYYISYMRDRLKNRYIIDYDEVYGLLFGPLSPYYLQDWQLDPSHYYLGDKKSK